jgi:putative membrane protein
VIRTMVLAGVASVCLAAPALSKPPGPAPATPDFIKAAASTDEFERQEGRLAEVRAVNPRVRDFGRMMVRDHTNTTMALKGAIRHAGLPAPPPPKLTDQQQANLATLKAARGADFDRTYVQQQIEAHQTALGVIEAYAAGGDNKTLRKAAAQTVPIVQRHLKMAQGIGH